MTSTEKLSKALSKSGAPSWMLAKAIMNQYHDYKSDSATPIIDLVNDCAKARAEHPFLSPGLVEIAEQAKRGEFDATKEESDAWAKEMANDPEMGPILKKLGLDAK